MKIINTIEPCLHCSKSIFLTDWYYGYYVML